MDLFVARVVDGLSNGTVYAFLALALVVVYRGSGHLNIAQGEMAMFATYLAWAIHEQGVPIIAAIGLAMAAAFVGGVVVERALIRPLGSDPGFSIIVATIGLFLVLNAGVGVLWDLDPHRFPTVVASGPDRYVPVLGSRVQYQQIVVLATLLVVLGLLWTVFRYTKVGLAMRTASSNPDSALLLGIRVSTMNALGWGLAAVVGALAASLIAPTTTLNPIMMFNFLIYAMAAAMLGGFDSPGGAVVAGVGLGVSESLVAGYVSAVGSDLKQGFALVVILVVLLVRPTGLFGSQRVERV